MKSFDLLLLTKGNRDEVAESERNAGEMSLVDYSPSEFDDKVILHGDVFKDLYEVPRYKAGKKPKLLSVIKITNKNGKSIHRAYLGKKGVTGFCKNHVALSHNSIRLLNGEDENTDFIDQVTISKGSVFCYFWDHPFHATRISMRLGAIGILTSVVLFMLSVCINLYSN